jgi:hypothetical protein
MRAQKPNEQIVPVGAGILPGPTQSACANSDPSFVETARSMPWDPKAPAAKLVRLRSKVAHFTEREFARSATVRAALTELLLS